MLSQGNSILFDQSLNQSVLLRKNIRVKSSKLPMDFFNNNQKNRYSPNKISPKKSIADEYTRDTFTPSFQRLQQLNSFTPPSSFTSQRKIGTARVNMNRDDTLINDVINTTKNIRRVFRKKSLELVRKSCRDQQIQLHLPSIKNSRRVNGYV